MLTIVRSTSENQDFRHLVKALDADLAERDSDDHPFYAQYNRIDDIRYAIVAFEDGNAVGCGAIKKFEPGTMEVKRMYVLPGRRNKGIARQILAELEQWARELACVRCVLETGKRQPEAIALYRKCGYSVIPNYGQYAGVDNSLCFEKTII